MRRHSAILCIGVLASFAVFAAAKPGVAQDKVIKIGGLFAMSGPGSYFGVQDKQGIELAFHDGIMPAQYIGERGNQRISRIASRHLGEFVVQGQPQLEFQIIAHGSCPSPTEGPLS